MRFGRLPADPARIHALPGHVMALDAPPPVSLPRVDLHWTPSLVHNDALPTCTCAGLLNSARMWALLHGYDLVSDDQHVLNFYAAVAGCEPTEAAISATSGLVMLDVLEHAQRNGFDIGAQSPVVPEFHSINPTDLRAIRDAIYRHGSAYIGVDLHQADESNPWRGDVTNAGPAVGGHCIVPFGYTEDGFEMATWGAEMDADIPWVVSRTVEAYAVAWTFLIAG